MPDYQITNDGEAVHGLFAGAMLGLAKLLEQVLNQVLEGGVADHESRRSDSQLERPTSDSCVCYAIRFKVASQNGERWLLRHTTRLATLDCRSDGAVGCPSSCRCIAALC
jgi:hypothetical protein